MMKQFALTKTHLQLSHINPNFLQPEKKKKTMLLVNVFFVCGYLNIFIHANEIKRVKK